MALIKCPECSKEISSKSDKCIYCGFPLACDKFCGTEVVCTDKDDEKTVTDAQVLLEKGDVLFSQKKYESALELFRKTANLGNAEAMCLIGTYYRDGLCVEQNYFIAKEWFERSIQKNHRYAYNNLGMMYKHGNGVSKDIDTALSYLKKASDMGLGVASHNIGIIYNFGEGVPRDHIKAVNYYTLALSQGYKNSVTMNNLAVLYMDGEGVSVNLEKAEELLLSAMQLGGATQAVSNYQILKSLKKRKTEEAQQASNAIKKYNKYMTAVVICVVIAGICILNILPTGMVVAGLLSAAFFLVIAYIIYRAMPQDARNVGDAARAQQQRQEQEWNERLTRTCPRCGKHTGHPISETSKKMSIAFWGMASDKVGKTYKCDSCDYMW